LWLAVILAVLGVCLNRWVMVLQVLAAPVLTFESWVPYFPSWQEIATTILPVALGIIMVSLSYRYLPIFPQEPELNPLETRPGPGDLKEPDTAEPLEEQAETPEGKPEPAQA
jgi:Ni/Fe-hydrogenase subunit HybB-like protein